MFKTSRTRQLIDRPNGKKQKIYAGPKKSDELNYFIKLNEDLAGNLFLFLGLKAAISLCCTEKKMIDLEGCLKLYRNSYTLQTLTSTLQTFIGSTKELISTKIKDDCEKAKTKIKLIKIAHAIDDDVTVTNLITEAKAHLCSVHEIFELDLNERYHCQLLLIEAMVLSGEWGQATEYLSSAKMPDPYMCKGKIKVIEAMVSSRKLQLATEYVSKHCEDMPPALKFEAECKLIVAMAREKKDITALIKKIFNVLSSPDHLAHFHNNVLNGSRFALHVFNVEQSLFTAAAIAKKYDAVKTYISSLQYATKGQVERQLIKSIEAVAANGTDVTDLIMIIKSHFPLIPKYISIKSRCQSNMIKFAAALGFKVELLFEDRINELHGHYKNQQKDSFSMSTDQKDLIEAMVSSGELGLAIEYWNSVNRSRGRLQFELQAQAVLAGETVQAQALAGAMVEHRSTEWLENVRAAALSSEKKMTPYYKLLVLIKLIPGLVAASVCIDAILDEIKKLFSSNIVLDRKVDIVNELAKVIIQKEPKTQNKSNSDSASPSSSSSIFSSNISSSSPEDEWCPLFGSVEN